MAFEKNTLHVIAMRFLAVGTDFEPMPVSKIDPRVFDFWRAQPIVFGSRLRIEPKSREHVPR